MGLDPWWRIDSWRHQGPLSSSWHRLPQGERAFARWLPGWLAQAARPADAQHRSLADRPPTRWHTDINMLDSWACEDNQNLRHLRPVQAFWRILTFRTRSRTATRMSVNPNRLGDDFTPTKRTWNATVAQPFSPISAGRGVSEQNGSQRDED